MPPHCTVSSLPLESRYGNRPRSIRDGPGLSACVADGRQRHFVQIPSEERRDEAWHHPEFHGETLGKCELVH